MENSFISTFFSIIIGGTRPSPPAPPLATALQGEVKEYFGAWGFTGKPFLCFDYTLM